MGDTVQSLVYLAIFGAVVLGIFLVARAIVLWYWRIDRIVQLLESQWQQSKSLGVQLTRLTKQMENTEDYLERIVALVAKRISDQALG